MVHMTAKRALRHALEDLSGKNFSKFCHELRDRREEPRIRFSDVEEKNVLQITDLLVSTFTEPKALQVTVDILRQINCNEEAEALHSKTKACMDKGDPVFRKTSTGELEMNPSQEALNHRADKRHLQNARNVTAQKPEEVEADAKARILSEGGDPSNKRLVLSRCMIQFGQYKGQTFKWLLENDLSYVAYIVGQQQKQRQNAGYQSPLMVNKDPFIQYATCYREVRFLQSGPKGNTLVGFGRYTTETLQDLYESKDKEKIGYVDFLRKKESTCSPHSKMEAAIIYILQRDRGKGAAAAATNRPSTSSAPRAVKRNRVPYTRGQSGPKQKRQKRSLKKTSVPY